jgi:hypothetical protein
MGKRDCGSPPREWDEVLKAIDSARGEARDRAMMEIERIERQRDRELARLDRAAALLGEGSGELRPSPPSRNLATRAGSKARRSKRPSTTPKGVKERATAVARLLSETAEPLPRGEIAASLQLTPRSVNTALKTLEGDGSVRRDGTGAATRYLWVKRSSANGAGLREQTLEGRILATIQDWGRISLEELVQRTGASAEAVQNACGALIREEEVRMGRHEGRRVYLRGSGS